MMLRLKQTDPRWSGFLIGNTNLTLGRWGCLITCVSMLTSWFQDWKRPDWLARYLDYTNQGLLIWGTVGRELKFTAQRFFGKDNRRVDAALKDPDQAVALEVNLGRGKHWVVATRKFPFTQHYFIADPLYPEWFKTTMAYDGYTGFAVFTRKKNEPR